MSFLIEIGHLIIRKNKKLIEGSLLLALRIT